MGRPTKAEADAKNGIGHDTLWLKTTAAEVLKTYDQMTVRQVYYQLVTRGLPNNNSQYDRVRTALREGRWEGIIPWDKIVDRERTVIGETKDLMTDLDNEVVKGMGQVTAWMHAYRLNQWENQRTYIEVWCEKKALQGMFEGPCKDQNVALLCCKGYPSLSTLHEAYERFKKRCTGKSFYTVKDIVILYFGDYDPTGEDIPRSLKENLIKMGCDNLTVKRIALNPDQIEEMKLPGVPAKETDTRAAKWTGKEVVEMDAIPPDKLEELIKTSIDNYFDDNLHEHLRAREGIERVEYQRRLRKFVSETGDAE